jgi:four helix bundle protein
MNVVKQINKVFSYQDLEVWKRSRKLVKDIYVITGSFPKSQQFSLCQQMQRAAVSIPSNIAEGQVKRATRDYIRHVNIALGSLAELDTQLLISFDLGYIAHVEIDTIRNDCHIVGRMLNRLVASLKNSISSESEARILEPEAL